MHSPPSRGSRRRRSATAALSRVRVLFVDDEPQVLTGLKNRLRRQRREWDMHFVSSSTDAAKRIVAEGFDVVVTDMQMPRMDGAALLAHIHDHAPETVCFVLTGESRPEATAKASSYARAILRKPCEATELIDSVKSALAKK